MTLARLKDAKNNVIHLNPDHVALVTSAQDAGSPILGQAAVVLINGMTLAVMGSPEEVSQVLNEQPPPKIRF